MSSVGRIYFDNAATSWPKPRSVYDALDRYQRTVGASPSRSVYAEAIQADNEVEAARAAVADFIGAESCERIVFTFNCTDALNLAIHGILRPGDHVVTSVADHNSVLRPLRWLEDHRGIGVTRVACNADGIVDPDDVKDAIRRDTRLIALVHASNVTGALQPVAEVGHLARQRQVLFLVDAAQSIGHLPIRVEAMNVDLLAAPGHKGLLAPLGTGFLYVRQGVEEQLESVRQGGTGTHSDLDVQPDSLPDKYEPGNLNVPGLCGLRAGIEYLTARGLEAIRAHEMELTQRLREGLAALPGIRLHSPRHCAQQVGVVSMSHPDYTPEEIARRLDASYRVQVRAGIHCAPCMHRALGTLDCGGMVRFSLGVFNTNSQVEQAVEAVGHLLAGRAAYPAGNHCPSGDGVPQDTASASPAHTHSGNSNPA